MPPLPWAVLPGRAAENHTFAVHWGCSLLGRGPFVKGPAIRDTYNYKLGFAAALRPTSPETGTWSSELPTTGGSAHPLRKGSSFPLWSGARDMLLRPADAQHGSAGGLGMLCRGPRCRRTTKSKETTQPETRAFLVTLAHRIKRYKCLQLNTLGWSPRRCHLPGSGWSWAGLHQQRAWP